MCVCGVCVNVSKCVCVNVMCCLREYTLVGLCECIRVWCLCECVCVRDVY